MTERPGPKVGEEYAGATEAEPLRLGGRGTCVGVLEVGYGALIERGGGASGTGGIGVNLSVARQ